jgi:hypothetical protein
MQNVPSPPNERSKSGRKRCVFRWPTGTRGRLHTANQVRNEGTGGRSTFSQTPLNPSINQGTLAEMIGTTRSRVSVFMNKFRKLGLISYNGKIEVHQSLLNTVLYDKPELQRGNAEQAREIDPAFPIIYMTGAAADRWASHGVRNRILLTKPSRRPSL